MTIEPMPLWAILILTSIAWSVTGLLAGLAVDASRFFSPAGKPLGMKIGLRGAVLLPAFYLLAIAIGTSGTVAHGFTLFGSEMLFYVARAIPMVAMAALGIYIRLIYLIRDWTT
jgi:hypothetical protein